MAYQIGKFLPIAWLLVLCAFVSGCTREDFTVDIHLDGFGSQNLTMVYSGETGVVEQTVLMREDRCSFTGRTAQPTVLMVLDARHNVLLRTVVARGDRLVIDGAIADLTHLTVTGNDAANQWAHFISVHSDLFRSGNATAIDAEIERYITAHPDSLCSALLLTCEYSALDNSERTEQLLSTLNDNAMPATLLASIEAVADRVNVHGLQVSQMNLVGTDGDFRLLHIPPQGRWLLVVTQSADRERVHQALSDRLSGRSDVVVADVSVDPDSSTWRAALRRHSIANDHYWAPGGMEDISLSPLQIRRTPFFVVNDSTGKTTYFGSNLNTALSHLP